MTAFVFTGADNTSLKLTRTQLVQRCDHMGVVVHNRVTRSADFLVASRSTTSKAGDARALGVTVITYDTFLTMWHVANGGTERLSRDDFVRIALNSPGTMTAEFQVASVEEVVRRVGAVPPGFDPNAVTYRAADDRWWWQGNSYLTRADAQIAKNRYDFRQANPAAGPGPRETWRVVHHTDNYYWFRGARYSTLIGAQAAADAYRNNDVEGAPSGDAVARDASQAYERRQREAAEAARIEQARLDAILQPGASKGRRALNLDD